MCADRHSLIAALFVLCACGRIGFDPSTASDGGGGDGIVDSPEVDAPGSSFAYVQGTSATAPDGTSIGATLSGQTVGNFSVVVVGIASLSAITSVVDDAGNVYDRAIGPTTGNGLAQWIYTSRITNTLTPNTLRVTFDQITTQPGLLVAEYAGVSTTIAVHSTSGLTGASTQSSSGPLDVTIAPALIIGANTNAQGGTAGPGAGYTQRLINDFEDILEDRVVGSPGTYVADAPLTTDHGWVMQAIALSPI